VSQSLSEIYLHIIDSIKLRQPFIRDRTIRERLHAYLTGTCNNLDCPSFRIGGVEDHVHIGCRLSKKMRIMDLLQELKRDSSKWMKEQSPDLAEFYWQSGYAVFSVSPNRVPALTAYIETQEEHHRQESFQDEVRRFCREYGAPLDERYAWD
jgi:REP element-mobilizing transposase RayT